MSVRAPKVLVIGCLGQVGTALVPALRQRFGAAQVVACDVKAPSDHSEVFADTPVYYCDVASTHDVERLVVEHRVDWVLHLASILSAAGEKNPALAQRVNIDGLHRVLDVAQRHHLRCFVPSSIAAFGGDAYDRAKTGNQVVQQPETLYGVSKVYAEKLGEYYARKKNLDFRSLRFPGIISYEALPGGGTTDYAVDIFYQALQHQRYKCFLREDTRMPMMYMEDAVRSTLQLMEADDSQWTTRVFNVSAMDFTPAELAAQIQQHVPDFQIEYEPDWRQHIADSWPEILDDSEARRQWGWLPKWGLPEMTPDMLHRLDVRLRHEAKH